MSQARVAILTVSDTAAADTTLDKSGPTIREVLAGAGYECRHLLVVPDDEPRIRHTVQTWADQGDVDWIVTTGGTGFGVRDRTPEAIRPLIEREAPGLVHLMMAASLQKTPMAALARPVAGTVKDTLVVTLPGSVKAVRENLEALLGEIRKLHSDVPGASAVNESVQSEHTHAHHHHHHHHHDHDHHAPQPRTALSHDPSQPVTTRHRESPYPLVTVEEALASILKEVEPLSIAEQPVTPQLKGHVLAEDVHAPQDVPSTSTTSVDGYALRSTDPPGIYKVVTAKTHNLSDALPAGTIFRINTGGPLPAGADTIIMVEDTRLHSTHKDATGADVEEAAVETLVAVPPGENVRAPGSDTRQGALALEHGQVLHAAGGEIGTLAFVGRRRVRVYAKPVVALLSTGNELLDLQDPKPMLGEWGGIWDTNRPSLQAVLEGMGYRVIDLGIVPDDLDAHVAVLKQGLEEADLLLTTGGTSMGASDLLKPVIERHLGGTIHFGRVKVKPGKPTTFATVPTPAGRVPVFALPGNPASALVTFHIFVLPALRMLGGWPEAQCQLPRVKVQLRDSMRLDPRLEYHRVVIKAGSGGLVAYSTGGQRSSRVASLSGANGLVALPPRASEGPSELKAGEVAEAVVIGELQMQ
ncbi:molybdenum cofactor biosynthesis protein [Fomitopsis serialis]|uniref:molybdenum cofactor biosynthesis protein n=1 Tax=Fomitopsis serialis TaxID=139415 RepID=UPI002008B3C8|nr:molybdenum cofactor biosynthesis protein [Neoantrodia serialis]KAH9938089.1 molybdenum cofactor biosynthesis protein [Neoantrodia serialis]